MEWTFIYVSSVTNAMRGRKLLEQQGLTVYMKRSSRRKENDGCGYVLQVGGNATLAKQLLTGAGIRVLRMENGGVQL